MAASRSYFIDTGAWVALAVSSDSHHAQAVETWSHLNQSGAKRFTSIPVIIETFTFLERNTTRNTALRWQEQMSALPRLAIWEASQQDMSQALSYFSRNDLHKLSLVDAISFVQMRRHKVTLAFSFDTHFSVAGFDLA